METLNILLVEDSNTEYLSCQAAVKNCKKSGICEINLTRCVSVSEVESVWNEYCQKLWIDSGKDFFDGAIIDLHLKNDAQDQIGGNDIIRKMEVLAPRMPVVIRTGTVDDKSDDLPHVYCVDRDSDNGKFRDLLIRFLNIRKTGLIDIMSGSGEIESKMNNVFQRVLMPQIDAWIDYSKYVTDGDSGRKVERALLRHSMNHLLDHLDQEDEEYYPEEFYLNSLTKDDLRTGNILREKCSNIYHVIMNPVCDLVARSNSDCSASHILLAEVEDFPEKIQGKNEANQKQALHKLCTNPQNLRYCLPSTKSFRGGLVNFNRLQSIEKKSFSDNFSLYEIVCQISPHFMKDMIAKFGAGYSRQGQPEVRTDDFLRHYLTHHSSS